VPLVRAAVGGQSGGGANLTAEGKLALEVFEQLRSAVHSTAGGILQRIIHPIDQPTNCLHLAAAISLQEVMGQLLAEYSLARPAVRVRAIYGASNELADHLLAGAPGNLFIAADATPLDRLAAAGMVARNSRRSVAENSLAIVGRSKLQPIKKPDELLSSRIKRIAVAEPECPLGKFSRAYLQANKIYEPLQSQLFEVDNSRAVMTAIESGTADVGIVFASDAVRSETAKTLLVVPAEQSGSVYEAVVLQAPTGRSRAGGKRSAADDEARGLLDFLSSRTAARCFQRYGFRPVQG
jgi:molybdate transport system substrate-binding protein